MSDSITQQNDIHVFVSVRQRTVGCSEEIKERVDEDNADHCEGNTQDDVESDDIAKNMLCRFLISLPKFH